MVQSYAIRFLFVFRAIFDALVDFIFALYYITTRRYISSPKDPIVLESGTSLARKIRLKETTSARVVQAFIERIKDVNGVLNAVVDERFEEALKEAKQIDQIIASGKLTDEDFRSKPFLGVPFTTKETTTCKGLKATFGLVSRKDITASEDATVVRLMKQAGGILLGVTNIPQLNRWTETFNPIYGRTNNPYDTTRNVGGSSGGEASIIAARGSPLGIGTDIGGSLRIPSHRCGIFGHKPTPELISTTGLTFRVDKGQPTMVTAGPMSTHCEDIIPILKVLLNDKVNRLQLDKEVDVKKLNIFYTKHSRCPLSSPISSEMQQLVLKCAEHFNLISNIKPQEIDFPYVESSIRFWNHMLRQEADDYLLQIMNNAEEPNAVLEVLKYLTYQSSFHLYTIACIITEKLNKDKMDEWAAQTIEELRAIITEKLGNDGVLICPSEAYPAGYHNTAYLGAYNFSYFCLWNALKLPATQVPIGLNEHGLPIGIQVIAGPYQDHLCIAVARELEKAYGGYAPPFSIVE